MQIMYVAVSSGESTRVVQFESDDGEHFEVVRADCDKIRYPTRVLKDGSILDETGRVIAGLNGWCCVLGSYEFSTMSAEAASAVSETMRFAKDLFQPKPSGAKRFLGEHAM